MEDYILLKKSKTFADNILILCENISKDNFEIYITQNLKHIGIKINANLNKASLSTTIDELIFEMQKALEKTGRCEYWLMLLYQLDYISTADFSKIYNELCDLNEMLLSAFEIVIAQK